MGFLDKLTGTERPEDGVAPQSVAEVQRALRAVAGPETPFVVREAADGEENADLVAEWRVQEPSWQVHFERREVSRLTRILMRLDETEHEVRSVDRTLVVTWRAGVAEVEVSKEAQRGQTKQISFRKTVGGDDGSEPDWSFSSDELKDPLKQAATDNGWTWKGVAFGKL